MNEQELQKLRFPIGEFLAPARYTRALIDSWVDIIAAFPLEVSARTNAISNEQLAWRYRPDGWSARQVIHHCADSHLNALMRFKLTLTEEEPIIRPYLEGRWAELTDYSEEDMSASLSVLEGVHAKLVQLMAALDSAQLDREYVHPEHGRKFTLKEAIGTYAWHGRHHLAHVDLAIESRGAFN